MNRTLILIPTYNERENVQKVCSEILGLLPDASLLFVDDGSPDGTGEILDQLVSADRSVAVIHRRGRQGVGSAHQAGIAWAYEQGYARLVTMDCDFTHSPAEMAQLLASADGFDVTVGSRFLRQDSLKGWSRGRVLLTRMGHAVTKVFLQLPFDASGALRVYDLKRIPREVFRLVKPAGYAFFFESLFVLARNGATIQQLPIVLPARVAGHSKMNFKEVVCGVSRLFLVCLLSIVSPGRFLLPTAIKAGRPALRPG